MKILTKTRSVVAVFAAILLTPLAVQAVTYDIYVPASLDTFVSSANKNQNNGPLKTMTSSFLSTNERHLLLSFTIPTVNGTIVDAHLDMYASVGSPNDGLVTYTTGTFTEATNWNNMPALGGAIGLTAPYDK